MHYYQYIVCSPDQYHMLRYECGINLQDYRLGPESDRRVLTCKYGSEPLSPSELDKVIEIGAEIVGNDRIQAWVREKNWEQQTEGV